MTAVTAVLCLLTFTLFVATSVQLPLPDGCSPVLVAFSPCLQYVSAPPNNMAETVPSQCCDAVNSAFNSGHGECLCEPLRQPLIFGFPLNETRLRSLSSVCHTSGSLESICSSGSSQTDLPPLHGGMTGPEIPNPPDSGSKQQFPFPSDSGEPQFPIPKPPDSSNLPHFSIPKPPDSSNLPHFPIPKPPDSSNLPHFPIPKPSDNLPPLPIPKPFDNHPQLPIPKPSDNHPQLPIPKPSDNHPQLPLPPLPFPKTSDNHPQLPLPPLPFPKTSDNHPQLPLPPLPFPKPSDSGKQPHLPLPPLPLPKPFDSGQLPRLPLPPHPLPKPSDSGQLPHLPLPPFHGATGPEIPKPFDPGHDNTSAPTTSSPTTPNSSVIVSRGSIATTKIFKSNSWFLPGLLISLLVFIHT